MTTGPAAHEAHDTPLAYRLVEQAISDWLNVKFATARAAAGSGAISDREKAIHLGIDDVESRLSGYDYTVVPAIIHALERAALLRRPVPAEYPAS